MQLLSSTDKDFCKVLSLVKTQVNQKYSSLMGEQVSSLNALYDALCRKDKNELVDLNASVTIRYALGIEHIKRISLLNIAANYCRAEVVKYLLENGAKADNKTIHYATKYNPDMENVVKELSAHHVDLNSLNKKGQTALYVATRKHRDWAVSALNHHHAGMLFFERVKAPVLNAIDDVKDRVEKAELAIFYPGLRGC